MVYKLKLIWFIFISLVFISNEAKGTNDLNYYVGKSYVDSFYKKEDEWQLKIVKYNASKETKAYNFQSNNENLPSILIVGDSISEGYTSHIQDKLEGKYNIYRVPNNIRGTAYALYDLKELIGESKFDLIIFNMGLHDFSPVGNDIRTYPEDYKINLDRIVRKILAPRTKKLLYVLTTHVPKGNPRKENTEIKYNNIAIELMNGFNIEIVDTIYILKDYENLRISTSDVHYTSSAYSILSEEIVNKILKIMESN